MTFLNPADHFTAKDGTRYRLDGVAYAPRQEPQVTWHSYRLVDGQASFTGMGRGTASDWNKMKEMM